MNIIDYDLYSTHGTIVLEKEVSERIGAIYSTIEFDFDTITDYYWDYIGGRDVEVPCLVLDTVNITSVVYEDEDGRRSSYAFDASEVEPIIEKLIENNLDAIEEMVKNDY